MAEPPQPAAGRGNRNGTRPKRECAATWPVPNGVGDTAGERTQRSNLPTGAEGVQTPRPCWAAWRLLLPAGTHGPTTGSSRTERGTQARSNVESGPAAEAEPDRTTHPGAPGHTPVGARGQRGHPGARARRVRPRSSPASSGRRRRRRLPSGLRSPLSRRRRPVRRAQGASHRRPPMARVTAARPVRHVRAGGGTRAQVLGSRQRSARAPREARAAVGQTRPTPSQIATRASSRCVTRSTRTRPVSSRRLSSRTR